MGHRRGAALMALFFRKDLAAWATPRQLRKAGLFADEGLILGRVHGRLLRHNGHEPLLMVAATGAGKTTCFVVPNLLTWRQSVIVHDPSFELYGMTAHVRGAFSRVVQLCPTVTTSQRYNPLDAIALRTDQEVRDVQIISDALTDPTGKGPDNRSGSEEHFTPMASEAAQGLLLYGLYTQQARSLGAMDTLLTSVRFSILLDMMERYPHKAIRRAAMVVNQAGERSEKSAVFTTLSRALRLYVDPLIQRATDTSDFALRDLRERVRPMTLYLSIPPRDQGRLLPWTRLVVRQLLDYAVQEQFLPEHRKTSHAWDVLAMVDEFQALGHLAPVEQMANYGRKFGLRLALITPSLKALEKSYGTHHVFLEACKVQVVFGLNDKQVAARFSESVGEQEVTKTRYMSRGQRSRETVKEPLFSATALKGLSAKKALVLIGGTEEGGLQTIIRKVHYQEKGWQHVD